MEICVEIIVENSIKLIPTYMTQLDCLWPTLSLSFLYAINLSYINSAQKIQKLVYIMILNHYLAGISMNSPQLKISLKFTPIPQGIVPQHG